MKRASIIHKPKKWTAAEIRLGKENGRLAHELLEAKVFANKLRDELEIEKAAHKVTAGAYVSMRRERDEAGQALADLREKATQTLSEVIAERDDADKKLASYVESFERLPWWLKQKSIGGLLRDWQRGRLAKGSV